MKLEALKKYEKLPIPNNALYRNHPNAIAYFNDIDHPAQFKELNTDEQQILVEWCKRLEKIKRFNLGTSSYGMKHVFERSPGGFYITNGALKGAMVVTGFSVKDTEVLNWKFNISKASYRKLVNEAR